MLKYLPGILLIQLITGGLVIIAFGWLGNIQLMMIIGLFAVVVGVLSAFWFASIARDIHKELLVGLQENHAREREKLLIDTEREKAAIAAESFKRIEKETKRVHAKANFKVGAAFTVAVGAGTLMLLTQLVTVGLVVLIGSGSGLAGYLVRVRQERLAHNKPSEIDLGPSPGKKLKGKPIKLLKKD
ncbi:MAG: hypothetical protein V3V31_16515 [Methylococcales bacterium]